MAIGPGDIYDKLKELITITDKIRKVLRNKRIERGYKGNILPDKNRLNSFILSFVAIGAVLRLILT